MFYSLVSQTVSLQLGFFGRQVLLQLAIPSMAKLCILLYAILCLPLNLFLNLKYLPFKWGVFWSPFSETLQYLWVVLSLF